MTIAIRSDQIRVMLVDDHPLVRFAVRQALASSDLSVVGEAATAEEAMETALEVRPDVMLVDIALPGMGGIELVRELAPRLPATRMVMLTVSTAERDLMAAMDQGASGYLTKDLSPEALQRAIRGAHAGDLAMPRWMADRLIRRLMDRAHRPRVADGNATIGDLSIREAEVLRMLADGLTDREIAETLVISIRTVQSHVSSVLHKMGVRHRAEAATRYRAAS
jgi:DNA-binding NarL/FixJ family response regulator